MCYFVGFSEAKLLNFPEARDKYSCSISIPSLNCSDRFFALRLSADVRLFRSARNHLCSSTSVSMQNESTSPRDFSQDVFDLLSPPDRRDFSPNSL